jgi:hypothetical protein
MDQMQPLVEILIKATEEKKTKRVKKRKKPGQEGKEKEKGKKKKNIFFILYLLRGYSYQIITAVPWLISFPFILEYLLFYIYFFLICKESS